MDIIFEHESQMNGQAVTFRVQEGEQVNVLHPQQIIAYRGAPDGRTDRLMTAKGMYRKKKFIQARFTGPCEFLTALPRVQHEARSIDRGERPAL